MSRMLGLVALVAFTGCGALVMTQSRPGGGCTMSPVPAILDTIAALSATSIAYFLSRDENDSAIIAGAATAVFGVSAAIGWSKVARCRA